MEYRSLFTGVMDDLEGCSNTTDEYHILRIAGLLRLLLLEGLTDRVSREFRHKIRFRVGQTVNTAFKSNATLMLWLTSFPLSDGQSKSLAGRSSSQHR